MFLEAQAKILTQSSNIFWYKNIYPLHDMFFSAFCLLKCEFGGNPSIAGIWLNLITKELLDRKWVDSMWVCDRIRISAAFASFKYSLALYKTV